MNADNLGPPQSPIAEEARLRATRRIEELVREIERSGDSRTRDLARELTDALLELHRHGLARLLALLDKFAGQAVGLREALLGDPLLANLLVLHDLHPLDAAERVAGALATVRPRLHAAGCDVAVVSIARDRLRLQLLGPCRCPSSSAAMQELVAAAVSEAAPDIATLEWEPAAVEEPVQNRQFVPLARLAAR
jgi:Fe-S cluster biogenesis protein NfuA